MINPVEFKEYNTVFIEKRQEMPDKPFLENHMISGTN